jgi:4-methylaminobutanoate oxidase (formaldehyde-forming)
LLHDRVKEVLGLHYMMPWPNRELASVRPFRRSPLYDRLAAKHAVFGSKMGWERPNFFAPTKADARIDYSLGRQNWFPFVAAEHEAVRNAVAVFDESSFAKFLLQGRDAQAVLQRLCANDISVPVGTSVYTGMLNERGTYESDLTVNRIAHDRFLLVTGTAQATRDAAWINRNLSAGAHAFLTDVTSAYAVIAVMGPKSRDVLVALTKTPLDNAAFPFGAIREIGVGFANVLALRRTYVGELGWELFVPVELATGVYDALMQAGVDLGMGDAGYYAIDSLRLEKGYRAWGRELTPDVTPYQAGLSFAVNLDKGDFIGRDALLSAKSKPPTKRLLSFVTLSPDTPLAHGGELILRNGAPAGEVTSAAYGHSMKAVVALGFVGTGGEAVDAAFLGSKFEIDIAGERVPVRASLKPPYDPAGAKLKG